MSSVSNGLLLLITLFKPQITLIVGKIPCTAIIVESTPQKPDNTGFKDCGKPNKFIIGVNINLATTKNGLGLLLARLLLKIVKFDCCCWLVLPLIYFFFLLNLLNNLI
uniref:LAGLIDADG homing endonuclease n=1 Tax=Fomitiporia mediterranea TaxID=208960 RepID=A0A5B9RB41_9AGAM|nr:hypothetical protein Fomme_000048 [Fomitiporia mediterranea]QEG57044.1 hypothetical protein Fomme_000048 [Fomitiporia mediterranea]